jgi:D-3-phosphoglycerate dehydrogenase
MYQVKAIDKFKLNLLANDLLTLSDSQTPDAILVRSSRVPNELISEQLLAITRAGIGTNTIDVAACTQNGTAVLNTPGANANAVKELIIQCLFGCVRPLADAISKTANLQASPQEDLQVLAEQERKNFVGRELYGKTLGILGLGTIGQRLAEAGYQLGMQVIGYNRSFKNLPHVLQLPSVEETLSLADFVVVLLPLTEQTQNFLSTKHFKLMKPTAYLLNFGRSLIVDNQAVLAALKQHEFAGYLCDFPKKELQNQPKITLLPHLGGNTVEALTSSTNLAVQSLLNFLESGTIKNSVNFPAVDLPFDSPQRMTFFFKEGKNLWSQIVDILNKNQLPLKEMTGNTSSNGCSYLLVNTDLSNFTLDHIMQLKNELEKIPEMIRIRLLDNPAEVIKNNL